MSTCFNYLYVQVMFGGGRAKLLPRHQSDPEHTNKNGSRLDGRNVICEWVREKQNRGRTARYVWNHREFDKIPDDTQHAIGKPSNVLNAHQCL